MKDWWETKKLQFIAWIFQQLDMKALLFRVEWLERQNQELKDIIAQLSCGVVDVHFKEETQIFVISRLGKGCIFHFPAHFSSLPALHDFVQHLRLRFGKTERITYDVPYPQELSRDILQKLDNEAHA